MLATCLLVISCTPAQVALQTQIENEVIADIQKGDTRQQIEADVGKLLGGQAGADVAIVLDDVLVLLIDEKLVPAEFLPRASRILMEEKPLAAARRAAKEAVGQ